MIFFLTSFVFVQLCGAGRPSVSCFCVQIGYICGADFFVMAVLWSCFFFFLHTRPSSLGSSFSSLGGYYRSSFLPHTLLCPHSSQLNFYFLLSMRTRITLTNLSLHNFISTSSFTSLPLSLCLPLLLHPSPPSSPTVSARALHPFRFIQFDTFVAFYTSFSSASGGRGFFVESVHPDSVHPQMLLFDELVDSFKGGLSVLPELVGGQIGPNTTMQLPPLSQLPHPSIHIPHSPQLSITIYVSSQSQ